MHELEKGIPAACKKLGVDPASLGIKGCLLIYRRREQDMPLQQPPDNATPEQIAKTEQVRQKVLRLARDKYRFRFQDRRMTMGLIEENGRLAGLRVAETKVEGRKAEPIPGTEHELRAPLVISSIGSVPEVLPGVAMKGEYYTFVGDEMPRYAASDHVFGVGNVVTGQGNIRVSLVHSQKVTNRLIENYVLGRDGGGAEAALYAAAESRAAAQAKAVEERIEKSKPLTETEVAAIEARIRSLQQRAGHTSDYDSWIAKDTPPDLE
jgi:ferredoxin--NADP+ reductase